MCFGVHCSRRGMETKSSTPLGKTTFDNPLKQKKDEFSQKGFLQCLCSQDRSRVSKNSCEFLIKSYIQMPVNSVLS